MGIVRRHTTSKKPKTKTRADLEAEASYAKFKAKWDAVPKFAHSPPPKPPQQKKPRLEELLASVELQHQVGKLDAGSTALRNSQRYTGTEMLGTAQLHKSNEVPVFKQQDIIDIATMRRG